MVCGGGGRVVGGRRGGGQDADVHGRDSGDQGDHAQQPGEPGCMLRGGRRGHVNQGIGSAYKYPYPLYVSVLRSCLPSVLPTPLCCPLGGAAHPAVLPTPLCCPLGGAAHPAVLPTRRCCPPHCAAHSTALPTRLCCPLDGAAHPRRCPPTALPTPTVLPTPSACPGGWLPTHFAYASHRHRLCEAYTRCVGPAGIRFRSARVRWLAASRGRIVRVYLRSARLVLRRLCTPR
ncbi:hypothetical protein APR11_002587 [Nocardia amikacinitolerans]|nr:hypothetical protein [Nocardia amikacinitolerans]